LKLVDLMNPKGKNILQNVKTWAWCVQRVLISSCLYSYHNAFEMEGNFIGLEHTQCWLFVLWFLMGYVFTTQW
jgi:hypothetical protein